MTLLDIDRLTLDLPDGTRLLDGISLSVDDMSLHGGRHLSVGGEIGEVSQGRASQESGT